MRITEVRTSGLKGATPEGGWSHEIRPDDIVHTLVAVHTDDGQVGIGSAFTSEGLVKAALDVLCPLLIGETALEPERVVEKLHQNSFWMGRGGSITHTISAVDIALWDLQGQALGQPVGRLLGGRYRDTVLPYASLLIDETGAMTDQLQELTGQGFRAFKIGWGTFGRIDEKTDERIVANARAAVGDDCLLAVDAGGSEAHFPGRLKWALRTSHMLDAYNVAWFEEPLPPDSLDDFVTLRRHARVPISGGEVFTRRQSFLPYLQAGAFDIVQPDTTKGGGLSESRRIGWMASDYGAKLVPHGWNTAVGLAADLQLASALQDTEMVEYKIGSAYIDGLSAGGWRLNENGHLRIPDQPGLGLKLNREGIERWGTNPGFADA
ncbi:mandelate racemase [Leifsonia sp. LS1]|uniref:mandelate racemase/muconate lactonizing enzyme family protein n=1 Tax=Leifsonia sp. LS1 TaxID=2828483 RepID=UPI001CFD512C|nr:mandelate racemase/muconate lactonizing enzyme family protein [Leifsonia sp. LS1]GIT82192.1 mandelate racemase [Leifsonia sp. LS1]